MNFNAILYDLSVYGAKTAVVLFVLLVLYRILGKRELGQMNVYDLVTIVALSNAVQNAMTGGKGDLWIGFASSGTLILLGFVLSKLFLKAPAVEKLFVGSPTILLYEGQVLTDRLRRQQVSLPELQAALHAHGLKSPKEAAMAVLEVDGSISVIPAGQDRHCTAVLN